MRKVLFFILNILISLFHAQTFATNVHGNTILTRYYFSDCYERDVDSLSNVTQRLYLGGNAYDATMMLEIDSAGSAISAPILSGGNSLYFGDPFMSASEYAYGVLGGALVGGTINGITASVNGKNFFTGKGKNSVEDIIAAYKDSFSLNEQHNTTNYSAHDSHNGINSSSTNNITNNNYTRFIANEDGSIIDMKPTIDRISKGETISRFRNDGTIFRNEELLLPKINTNYTEWVVPTPGLPLHRAGPMRIVFGGERYWFTNDHYKSFILLNP